MIASSDRRRRSFGRTRGVLALAVLLAWSGAALADEPPPAAPPTDAQLDAARALYKEARELHRQGKLALAIDQALAAYRTAATPVTALQAATFLVEAGRLVEARDLARAVPQIPVSPHESDKGRDARADAAQLATSLDGRIPKLAFAGAPHGAEVALDGTPIVAADASSWRGVDPGAHVIVVRLNGRACASINATLAEGEERTLDLRGTGDACAPPAAPPAPSPAPTETAPGPAAAPGPTAVPPAPLMPSPPPASGGNGLRWGGLAVGGAGALAVAVGGVLALSAKSDYDSVASACPPRGCTQDAYDVRQSARSRADVATVTMIVGGAVLATGAVLFFWPTHPSQPAAGVAVGPASARFVLRF
jgi:hypothetical protein